MEHSHHSSANPSSCSATTDANSLSTATITMSSDGGKASNNNTHSSLRSLNRASYKITKPIARDPNASPNPNRNPNLVSGPSDPAGDVGVGGGGGLPYQTQPPVYNIDKSDFRDVVQKLTGSPAHNLSRPPCVQAPAPSPPPRPRTNASIAPPTAAPISRLHRIRPPPLAHLSPRPRPSTPFVLVPCVPPVDPWTRPPFSPLPPLPTVSSSAESPISAYMRRLRGGGLPSISPSPSAGTMHPPPSSPLGLGCLLSQQTEYQMMTTSPALQLPTSPGVQLASPKMGDL